MRPRQAGELGHERRSASRRPPPGGGRGTEELLPGGRVPSTMVPQGGYLVAVQIGAAGRLRLRDGLVPGHGRLAPLGTSPAVGSRLTGSRRPPP